MSNSPNLFDFIRPSFDLILDKKNNEKENELELRTATNAQQPMSRTEPGGYGLKE